MVLCLIVDLVFVGIHRWWKWPCVWYHNSYGGMDQGRNWTMEHATCTGSVLNHINPLMLLLVSFILIYLTLIVMEGILSTCIYQAWVRP